MMDRTEGSGQVWGKPGTGCNVLATLGGTMDFELIWQLYPRKVAKKAAEMVWRKMSPEHRQAAINALPAHIRLWDALETSKEYMPHLRTWLYQERWTDEIEMPKPKEAIPAWWTSDQGILAKGKEIGLVPRPGETIYDFKGRVQMYLQQSRASTIGRGDSGNF